MRVLQKMRIWYDSIMDLGTKWACSIYMILNIARLQMHRKTSIFFLQTFLTSGETTCHREKWIKLLSSLTMKRVAYVVIFQLVSPMSDLEIVRCMKLSCKVSPFMDTLLWLCLVLEEVHWSGTCLPIVRHMSPGNPRQMQRCPRVSGSPLGRGTPLRAVTCLWLL